MRAVRPSTGAAFTIAGGSLRGPALIVCLMLTACSGEDAGTPTPEQLARLGERSAAYAGQDVSALQGDTQAMALGAELFGAHCAGCHGSDARDGKRAVPDLVAGVFDYGDTVDAIRTTIGKGRHSVMPKHAGQMGEVDVGSLVSYVRSLSSGEEMDLFLDVALSLYGKHCVSCHGPEGRGNLELGVPDLTDSYWQHGDSMMNVRMTISGGAESQCPAQEGLISVTEIELLTAHVVTLRAR